MVTKLRTLLRNQAARPAPKVFATFFSSLKTVVSLGGVDCRFQQFGKKLIFPMIFFSKCFVHSVEFNLLALFFGQILSFAAKGPINFVHLQFHRSWILPCHLANLWCPESRAASHSKLDLKWTGNKNTPKKSLTACLAISAPSSKACSFQRIKKRGNEEKLWNWAPKPIQVTKPWNSSLPHLAIPQPSNAFAHCASLERPGNRTNIESVSP